jgi:hypothetical protein
MKKNEDNVCDRVREEKCNLVFVKIFVEDVLKRPRKHGVNEVVIIKITSLLLLS